VRVRECVLLLLMMLLLLLLLLLLRACGHVLAGACLTVICWPGARRRGRPRRAEGEEADAASVTGSSADSASAQKALREIYATPEWGLGVGGIGGECLSAFARVRKLWQVRGDQQRAFAGPFKDEATLRWMEDERKQLRFAEAFAVPLANEAPLRALPSDSVEVQLRPDYSKLMLSALMLVEKPTCLEVSRSPLVREALLLQHGHDRRRDMIVDGGAMGGMQGLASCVFWRLELSDDQRTYNRELLLLAEVGMCLRVGMYLSACLHVCV